MLGQALAGRREDAVIATKFGYTFDAGSRTVTGEDASPDYIRRACRASLRRLGTDWIDLYQLHLGDLPAAQAEEAAATLEELADRGADPGVRVEHRRPRPGGPVRPRPALRGRPA